MKLRHEINTDKIYKVATRTGNKFFNFNRKLLLRNMYEDQDVAQFCCLVVSKTIERFESHLIPSMLRNIEKNRPEDKAKFLDDLKDVNKYKTLLFKTCNSIISLRLKDLRRKSYNFDQLFLDVEEELSEFQPTDDDVEYTYRQDVLEDHEYTLASQAYKNKMVDIKPILSQYIGVISPVQYKILCLKIIDDLTFAEIAKELDMNSRTVDWHFYRAIKKIKKNKMNNQ